MKKLISLMLFVTIFSVLSKTVNAQDDKIKDKNEEVVIRKNGNKDVKVTVEIKDDDILINGKPLSEFNDDNVSVIKRKKLIRDANRMPGPGHLGGNSFFFNGDADVKGETRPFLGVTTETSDKGVKITDVAKGSAAEKAGLKQGDVITSIGSKKISDPENLMDVVTSYKPKEEVKIYYERNGKSNDTKAVLGEKKESMRSFSYNRDGMPRLDENMLKEFDLKEEPFAGNPLQKFWMNSHKKLGVRIGDTENDAGANITNVEQGSAAEKAGLKKDDIITQVDGKNVKNVEEAREEILQKDKTNYTIKAKRNGAEMNFDIKIPKDSNSADL